VIFRFWEKEMKAHSYLSRAKLQKIFLAVAAIVTLFQQAVVSAQPLFPQSPAERDPVSRDGMSRQEDGITLYGAIQHALQHNQTVLYSVEQNHLSARAQLEGAEAIYNPTLSAGVNLSRNFTRMKLLSPNPDGSLYDVTYTQQILPNVNAQQTLLTPLGSRLTLGAGVQTSITGLSSLNYQTTPQLTLSYQQPLSASGIASGHADIVRARQSCNQAEMSYRLQKEQLVLSVIQSYFQLWQALRTVEQSERDFESTKRVLDIAELKLKSGSIPEFEVLNVRVQCRLSEDNLLQARNSLKTQNVLFLRLLGDSTKSSITLVSDIPLDTITFSLNEAIETAIQNRLEVKQIEISLELGRLAKEQLSSALSPTLRVNASYNLSSLYEPTFINSLALPNYGWYIYATVSMPILDGGRTASQVEIAERSISVLEKNLSLLKEEISIDIENRYRTLELNRHRLSSLSLSLTAAAEALKIAELRFQSGQISSTEIENVRNRYNAAQNALNGAKISYVLERAGLAKAMGELFSWVENLERQK